MSPDAREPESSLPPWFEQFEREFLASPDPAGVLDRYLLDFPDHSRTLVEIAECLTFIQECQGDPPSRVAPERPNHFDRFRVVDLIGKGGMGEVYEAVEEPLGRHVAIKALRLSTASRAALLRFQREQRILAALHHTNIVPIYATGKEGELLYYAMPYLAGASLGEVLRAARAEISTGNDLSESSFERFVQEAHKRNREGGAGGEPPILTAAAREFRSRPLRFTPAYLQSVVDVIATIAEGLQHAHDAGFVHRDLSPRNMLVEVNGHAWLLDFGLAAQHGAPSEAAGGAAAETSIDLTVGTLGTPGYVAPELRGDARNADARSDVWSLGTTLYELLTLRRPSPNDPNATAAGPIAPRRLSPTIDHALQAIVLKALHENPDERYQTAHAFANDLRRWRKGELADAWPRGRFARAAWGGWLLARRNQGWAAAIVAVLIGLVGLVFQLVERRRATERHLEVLEIQSAVQGPHEEGWSGKLLQRIAAMNPTSAARPMLQPLVVAALTGLDVSSKKELPIHARSLAFDAAGRLWMGHTGAGLKRWDVANDRIESWPLELAGPLAIRPDGAVWQIGPTYPDPDLPDRIPLDPRPNPRFPLQRLDALNQRITRTFADPIEGGSRLLAWTLSPKGERAAALVSNAEGQSFLPIWNAETGELLHRPPCPTAPESPARPAPGLTFAPDASVLARWDGDGKVDLWDGTTGRRITEFSIRYPVSSLAFGPNHWLDHAPRNEAERWMVAVGDANSFVTLWNPAIDNTWHVLHARGNEIHSLAFNPDGTWLASSGRAMNLAQIWDVASGRRLLDAQSGDSTMSLAFSPDGASLASSSWNAFAEPWRQARSRVFQLEADRGIHTFHGLPGEVVKTRYSRDGRRVAALTWDWWAGVWDRDTGRLIRILAVPRGQFADNADLTFSPDGRRLAITAGQTATLWDLETGQFERWDDLPWALTEAIAFAGADRLLLFRTEVRDGSRPPDSEAPVARFPRVCVLRDLLGPNPGKPIKVLDDFAHGVQDIEAAPDGSCFVILGLVGPPERFPTYLARIYDPNGRQQKEFTTRIPSRARVGNLWIDSSSKLLILMTDLDYRQDVYELRDARFLRPALDRAVGIASDARLWVKINRSDAHFDLCDSRGTILVRRLIEASHQFQVHFSPDLDGRHLLWGTPTGLVRVADRVAIRKRMAAVGLGW